MHPFGMLGKDARVMDLIQIEWVACSVGVNIGKTHCFLFSDFGNK